MGTDSGRTCKEPEKFIRRRVIDISMTAVIVILMAFQITGQTAHEWLGVTMFLLFLAHTFMNRRWYRNLPKGRYRAGRVLQTVTDLMLLVCFVLAAVTGMLMSQHAVPFFRIETAVSRAREMHLAFSHWTFLLVSIHLGLHFRMMARSACTLIQKKKAASILLSLAAVLAAGYGMFLTVREQMYSYMLFRVQFAFFDYDRNAAAVITDNILMISSWAFIAYEIAETARNKRPENKRETIHHLGMIAAEFAVAFVLSLIIPAH